MKKGPVAFAGRIPLALLWSLVFVIAAAAEEEAAEEEATKEEVTKEEAAKEDAVQEGAEDEAGGDRSRISDERIPLQLEDFPDRPTTLLEIGDPFMHPGVIGPGIIVPTGAVWQPSLLAYGTFRSGFIYQNNRNGEFGEWANRLDLFFNLRLSGTERFLLGLRPLDRDGRFTGYQFEPLDEAVDEFNVEITTAFFEGDIGEIFPNLDPNDFRAWDLGFSVGRQPFIVQDGLLVADSLDAAALNHNNLRPRGFSNLLVTGVFAWNEVNRGDNRDDGSATLYGLLLEGDLPWSTINFDIIGIAAGPQTGDGLYFGLSGAQRIGHLNTTFRGVISIPLERETSAVGRGGVIFGEISWVPVETHDNVYINAFVGIGNFTSAARDDNAGGPLGRVGILFAATGLGSGGSPLSNQAQEVVGAAVGWQHIYHGGRRQLILELAGRVGTDGSDTSEIAFGARWQRAIGRRMVLIADGYVGWNELVDAIGGARLEILVKF